MGRKDKAITLASDPGVSAIGARMREVRQANKITLTALAGMLGYTKNHLSSVENGHTPPSRELIAAYERALHLAPDELLYHWNDQVALAEMTSAAANDATVTTLISALADAAPAVRKNAATALGYIGNPVAIQPLNQLLLSDSDEDVRASVALALGVLRSPIEQALVNLLDGANEPLHQFVAARVAPEDVEDICAETWEVTIEHLRAGDAIAGGGSPLGYVLGIARLITLRHAVRQRRRQDGMPAMAIATANSDTAELHDLAKLREALDTPEDQVVLDALVADKTIFEMARDWECQYKTAWRRLHKFLDHSQTILRKIEQERELTTLGMMEAP